LSLAAVPNPAVADDRARRATGDRDDPSDGTDQQAGIRRVTSTGLVVGDEPALVLDDQGGVAELGRVLRLALADRAASGSASEISRSPMVRTLPRRRPV
jgi:hypothetical protein